MINVVISFTRARQFVTQTLMPYSLVFALVAMGYWVCAANSILAALFASLLAAFAESMIAMLVQGWTNTQLINSSLNIAINNLQKDAHVRETSGSTNDDV